MKKSYYCEKLEKTLHFLPDGVKFCCSCAEGAGMKINDFSQFNFNDVIKTRDKFIKMLRSGIIPSQCNGCVEYKEIKSSNLLKSLFKKPEKKLVSHIIADHYKQCDCSCIYCSQKKLFPNITQNYELLPVIKKLYDAQLIDENNLKVEFQGGNISVLIEFPDLFNEFRNHKCNKFIFLTNFIKYISNIENLDWESILCVSLDSGTSETFKKIKNVDAFNTVIENLKKIREKSQMIFHLKYIIISGVNDNIEELNKFLAISKEIDNKATIILEFDYNSTIMSEKGKEFKVPEHYYKMYNIAEEYCKNNGLTFFMLPHTKSVLDAGVYIN